MINYFYLIVCFLVVTVASSKVNAIELSGNVEVEWSAYQRDGQFPGQGYQSNLSLSIEPEWYWQWNGGSDRLVFIPFLRGDEHDAERSHGDIRELSWVHVGEKWEFRTGFRKVFWGVTEFNHLVDIINQTDSVDSFDGEEKLGQPMLNISRVTDWGIVDAFVLVGFRERTFAGAEGRLRGRLVADTDRANYESTDEEKHIDYALRWSHSVGVFDVGLYWFDGTDRNPILQTQADNGVTRLIPFYQQVTQVGVDLQATIDSWLWKLEAIQKDSRQDDYLASQVGVEYTLYGLNSTATDVGILVEYGWDERDYTADNTFQNDIFLGFRFTLNDPKDSALLISAGYDADFYTKSLLVEASTRFNDYWTIALEGVFVESRNVADPAAVLVDDDRLQLTVKRYF
ncbi:hypothetical protein AB835_01070 [Candidatus Endobugula sertula]|uniref:Porin domain-containing protein n=1 Tax=Candidatus Endobugula sertula TaxID=62101 RepID=A0A1D2QTG5_9GAMM|nr:hypothetical protein AB835_01070 [Candidatus Endobugula sertula]